MSPTNSPPPWTNTPSGTMTAAALDIPNKTLVFSTTYSKPTLPSEDWIVIAVKCAGLNHAELRSRTSDPQEKANSISSNHTTTLILPRFSTRNSSV